MQIESLDVNHFQGERIRRERLQLKNTFLIPVRQGDNPGIAYSLDRRKPVRFDTQRESTVIAVIDVSASKRLRIEIEQIIQL